SVQFLVKIVDVTSEIMPVLEGLSGAARAAKQTELLDEINSRYTDPEQSLEARTGSFFKGNQFILFQYQRYTDIRLVGTPPESVGKFGGDTDNWEWPR